MRARSRFSLPLALFALTLGLTGCAAGSGGGSSAARGSSNSLTAEALVDVQQLDAYQAIQRLRPGWLRSRGNSEPAVVLDRNRQSGGLNSLRSIRVSDLQEIEYMSASDATMAFGTGYDGGAIVMRTKR